MKNMILASILSLLLISGIAFAGQIPAPISVKITTATTGSNIDVIIKDVGLNKQVTYKTNEYGEIIFDADVFGAYRSTDMIQVSISTCSLNSACVQSKVLGDAVYFEFDLTGIITQPCPTCSCSGALCSCSGTTCICPTPIACNSCCECPDLICPEIPVCTTCEVCKVCPDNNTTLQLAITAIISVLVSGTGVYIFKSAKGVTSVRHKHKNYGTLHDINIIHPIQPHPAGEIIPRYATVKSADKHYAYLGG